ncbi:unnamed protein product, partial [Protopolystoma xenopodis]
MGCIVSSLACCFCSSAASLCCHCLPSCKSSTSSRLMYGLILLISALLSALTLIPEFGKFLTKIPALCTSSFQGQVDCSLITGFGAVYRICFGTSMFFILLCLLMIRVRSSKDPRSRIHNGFWFFKFLIWIALIVAAFFIPANGFTFAWMIIGTIGGAIYIVVQLILLTDFVHSWNSNWVDKYEETEKKAYACAIIFFTLLFYVASIAGVVCFYIFYASAPECVLHKVLISVNLILCFIFSVVSILPIIHRHLPKSGLLQSSSITLYIMYLSWSAMTNNPDRACNPAIQFVSNASSTDDGQSTSAGSIDLIFNWQIFIGLLILIFSVIYSTIRSSS